MLQPPIIHYASYVAPMNRGVNINAFLRALADVESGSNWSAIGAAGELGPWQITHRVWCQNMNERDYPFRQYARDHTHSYARQCAIRQTEWLTALLRAHQLPVTAENLAMCWRMGFHGAEHRIRSGQLLESATRVGNLYATYVAPPQGIP